MNLEDLKNSTKDSREFDNLKQYPLALRRYYQKSSAQYDKSFDNRSTDTFLQRFMVTRYPISDRQFGAAYAEICNIFLNNTKLEEIDRVIEDMLSNREWIYHPVRSFEKWHNLSKMYYNNESYFWLILLFNRINDPFRALQDFNMVRIPNFSFLYRIPISIEFQYDQVES